MSNTKHLCWSCTNCTSIHKCPFVKRLNDFYEAQKQARTLTTLKIINEEEHFMYNPVPQEQLKKLYIEGTKTNSKGDIIECPKYNNDGLIHNKKAYLKQLAKKNNVGYEEFRRKYEILEQHFERVQEESPEEREEKRKKANEYIQNILLKRQIEEQRKQEKVQAKALNKQAKEPTKVKKVTMYEIRTNHRLTKKQKIDLFNMQDKQERTKQYNQMLYIYNHKQQLNIELQEIARRYKPYKQLNDTQIIEFIKQINACYIKNCLAKPLTAEQIQILLEDTKRLIQANKLFLDLDRIFIKTNLDERKQIEEYYIYQENKRIAFSKRRSEIAKQIAQKRKEQKGGINEASNT